MLSCHAVARTLETEALSCCSDRAGNHDIDATEMSTGTHSESGPFHVLLSPQSLLLAGLTVKL